MTVKAPILWQRGGILLLLLAILFFGGYRSINYFTSMRQNVNEVAYVWEKHIPFIESFMLPYMSIDLFFAASLFMFRRIKPLHRHALRLALAMLISYFGFLLFPLKFSTPVPHLIGFNGWLQDTLFSIDKPFNQAPSLHISLLIVLWVCYAKKLADLAKIALHAWFFAIGASVLLVYQHHFIDVWTGALAGVACLYLIPDAPFAWRWQRPTARMQSLGWRYALGAILLLVFALILGKISGFLSLACIWAASALLLVAAAYFGLGRQVFQRHCGHMRWPARLMLAPYLLGSWLSYLRYTKNKSLPNQILGNVWLGAFPRIKNAYTRFNGVLDLSNEFANLSISAPLTRHIPVLDLTPPCPQTLVKAANWLDYAQQKGDVLVHCALGVSRSASVVVCWLVWRGHAANTQAAVAQVNMLRPGLVLSTEHITNIEAALQLLRAKKS